MQISETRNRTVTSDFCKKYKHTRLDLIIADIPENLPVPGISTLIPDWNKRAENYVETLFEMADMYFHDDGALVLIHSNDRSLLKEIDELADQYDMKLVRDWWGINELSLASARDPSTTVNTKLVLYFSTIFTDLGGCLE